ncbi:MAG TPA: class C beta-lactamase [Candidatus Cybelea sp.]|jgi:beta-lactamase class C
MRAKAALLFGAALFVTTSECHAAGDPSDRIAAVVNQTIAPLMAKEHIPGMAVGIVVDGTPYAFTYGVASKQTMERVTPATLFEIGSVSKTFNATLASYAQLRGDLSFSQTVGTYLPALAGTPIGSATLINLGTHTAGNFPMQVPDAADSDAELIDYLRTWHPNGSIGTYRVYSNIGIGTLGLITAKRMGQDFAALEEQQLFPALGLTNTYVNVPPSRMSEYAQGYRSDGTPIRMVPGELWQETYGVRTCVTDLDRYMQANMGLIQLDPTWEQALSQTHVGYFRAGVMTQDLIWEQYSYPVALKTLLEGTAMIEKAVPVTALQPPLQPQSAAWLNKTGSTNGFSTYIAFVPTKRVGIVMLANKSYGLSERVTAAFQILSSLQRE